MIRRSRGAGGLEVDVDVAARVDDGGDARRLVGDERRQVAEAVDRELRERIARESTIRDGRRGPMLDSPAARGWPRLRAPQPEMTA